MSEMKSYSQAVTGVSFLKPSQPSTCVLLSFQFHPGHVSSQMSHRIVSQVR